MRRWFWLSFWLHVGVLIVGPQFGGPDATGNSLGEPVITVELAADLPSETESQAAETTPQPEPQAREAPQPEEAATPEPEPTPEPAPSDVAKLEPTPEPTPPDAPDTTEPPAALVPTPPTEPKPAEPPKTEPEPQKAAPEPPTEPKPVEAAKPEPIPEPAPDAVEPPKPDTAEAAKPEPEPQPEAETPPPTPEKPPVPPEKPEPKVAETPPPAAKPSPPKKKSAPPPRKKAEKPRRPAAPKPSKPRATQQARARPRGGSRRPGKDRNKGGILDPYIAKYRARLARLKETFTDRHPDVVATERILAQLEAKAAPLSAADYERIREQIASCWAVPPPEGAPPPAVELEIALDPEGKVVKVRDTDPGRAASDAEYGAVSKSAQEAIHKCSPLWLPLSAFQAWRTLTLTLDPAQRTAR